MSFPRKLVLLGATGSIGKSSLRVIRKHPDKLKLIGISAYQKADELASIAREFGVSESSPASLLPLLLLPFHLKQNCRPELMPSLNWQVGTRQM